MSDERYRVRHLPNQNLRTQDFRDEQHYHMEARRAHDTDLHSWGMIRGLRLAWDPDKKAFSVTSGVGVTMRGDEVSLDQPYEFATTEFDTRGTDVLDVYLGCDERDTSSGTDGFRLCREHRENSNNRTAVSAVFSLAKPGTELPFTEDTRLLLGRMLRDVANEEEPFRVDLAKRDLSGILAARIDAPSGSARLELGVEETRPVVLYARHAGDVQGDGSDERAILEIGASDAELSFHGDAVVEGHVRVNRIELPAPKGAAAPEGEDAGTQDTDKAWSTYTALVPKEKREDGGGDVDLAEWRIALPDVDEGEARFVVGALVDDTFEPRMSIYNDGRTVFHGDVHVEGGISGDRVPQEAEDEARALLISGAFAGALNDPEPLLEYFQKMAFRPLEVVAAQILAEEQDREVFIDTLRTASTETRSEFYEQLMTFASGDGTALPELQSIASKLLATAQGTQALAEALGDPLESADRLGISVATKPDVVARLLEPILAQAGGLAAVISALKTKFDSGAQVQTLASAIASQSPSWAALLRSKLP